jgi:hypothetical protein
VKDKRGRDLLAMLYLVFVWPLFLAWPVLWALPRWRTWEVVAWCAGAGVGALLWVIQRDRERNASGSRHD